MATAQATSNIISLKGSTQTVTEFFQYALSSILYQRGVYPPESFEPKKQYGLTVMAVKDDKLCTYLLSVLKQFSGAQAPRGRLRAAQALASLTNEGPAHHPCRVAGDGDAAKGGAGHHERRQQGGGGALDL